MLSALGVRGGEVWSLGVGVLAEKLNGEEQILWARGGGGDTAEVPAVGVATCQAGLHRLWGSLLVLPTVSGRLAGGVCTGRPPVFVHLTPGPTAGFPVRISALWATWRSPGAVQLAHA